MKRILGFVAFILVFVFFLVFSVATSHGSVNNQFNRIEDRLAKKLAGEVGKSEIENIFSDPRVCLQPELLKKLDAKGKGLSYFSSEFGLLNFLSLWRGRSVLKNNSDVFSGIEKRYEVEKEALAAIFRIETNFGENTGKYRTFNALLTFSVLKNRRSEWAEKELANLLLLSFRNQLDVLGIHGSWAGAFGLCQFVPTSFLAYAVDGNGDGRADLFVFEDAMASAANYLRRHGWKNGDVEKKKKAIFAYNRSEEYVKAVLAYAEAVKK
ncbi:MAG: lytic murein transglycosylase [Candidatus Paceibacterota bacterium]